MLLKIKWFSRLFLVFLPFFLSFGGRKTQKRRQNYATYKHGLTRTIPPAMERTVRVSPCSSVAKTVSAVAPLWIQLRHILHRHCVAFQDIGKLARSHGHRTLHEFRHIIAFHELPMIVGVAARQLEGLRPLAVFVDVGKERTCVLTVMSATAEHEPSTVARP